MKCDFPPLSSAQQDWVVKWMNAAGAIAWEFHQAHRESFAAFGVAPDDSKHTGYLAICEAAHRWRCGSSDPETRCWIRSIVVGSLIDELRSIGARPKLLQSLPDASGDRPQFEEVVGREPAPGDSVDSLWDLFREQDKSIDPRWSAVIRDYLNTGDTMKQVGVRHGISESMVCRIVKDSGLRDRFPTITGRKFEREES
jgi:hypothetical protein